MQRPSITFVNRVYPPARGATGRVLRDLAKAFAREGWQVTIIATSKKNGKERDGAVRVLRVKGPENPRGIFAYMLIWWRLFLTALRQPAPHILVTMTDPPLLVAMGSVLSIFKRFKHIHWCHDLYPDILSVLNPHIPSFIIQAGKKISRRSMSKADKVIVIGRCMARRLAYDGLDPSHLAMIPNWPDFELSQDVRSDHVEKRDISHAHVAKPYDLGMVHPIGTILDAAEILQDECPDVELVFVGDGLGFDRLASARTLRGLDNVKLLPYQPVNRLKEMLESGDVHLISMKDEAGGLLVPCKFYSALAVQRPCIFVGPAVCAALIADIIKDITKARKAAFF
jgi:glycosyltransferase involved in cell wall biosynthesis